ncbi:hypothetical protein KIN20_002020 [Parelaphostrongylus tenuis]|uniref:Uncharacterized protein n=1 Tax=Parelaphostrongylus tenuis TaxID=148309 RepID=A0AAD5QCR0_PARTN|nr:hypothetical protein KIN20_002020 [Parelaphostrongylus tenuis]
MESTRNSIVDILPKANNSMVEVNKFFESYFTRSNSTTVQEWEANLQITRRERRNEKAPVNHLPVENI